MLLVLIAVLLAEEVLAPPPKPTLKVTLAWDAPAESVDGYNVYMLDDLQAQLRVFDAGTNLMLTIINLSRNTQYYFAATACRGGLESEYSNEVGYKTPRK